MPENNPNESFEEFFRRFMNDAQKNNEKPKPENDKPENPFSAFEELFKGQRDNEPRDNNPEDFFSTLFGQGKGQGNSGQNPFEVLFGGNGNGQNPFEVLFGGAQTPGNSGNTVDMNELLNSILGNQAGSNEGIENLFKELSQGFHVLRLPPLSAEEADEVVRVVNEIMSNMLGQGKKNPLEDVDTSNIDSELEKLLKNSVNNAVKSDDEDTPRPTEAVFEDEETVQEDEVTREIAQGVKASIRKQSGKIIVSIRAPHDADKGSERVRTSYDEDSIVFSYLRDDKLYEQVVRIRGLNDRGVVAFVPQNSKLEVNEDTWKATLGVTFSKDVNISAE